MKDFEEFRSLLGSDEFEQVRSDLFEMVLKECDDPIEANVTYSQRLNLLILEKYHEWANRS